MLTKLIIIMTTAIVFSTSYAIKFDEAKPCSPMPNGTYCIISPKTQPVKNYRHIVNCGNTTVYVTARQKRALDAYLRENQNMILRFSTDNEYIDSPCF